MGLSQETQSKAVYLKVQHFCLWQELKGPKPGSVIETVTNPESHEVMQKHGIRHKNLTARAIKIEEYKREHQGKRYTGYKLHLRDGADLFILDLPEKSRALRNFLKTAPSINWDKPLSITVFKGKGQDGKDEQAFWLQQKGEKDMETLKFYFTKENPHGMPEPKQHPRSGEWDFSAQHDWLVERLMNNTAPDIAAAAARFTPPPADPHEGEPDAEDDGQEPFAPIEGEVPAPAVQQTYNRPAAFAPVPASMPRSGGLPAADPQLQAWLNRASLNAVQAGKVITEVCDKCFEYGSDFANAAWAAANKGQGSAEETIRSLWASLQKAPVDVKP